MKGNIQEIMKTVDEMRQVVNSGDKSLAEVLETFSEFKDSCPKLFEMVLENKPGYYTELQNMVNYANKVNTGVASLEDATKVVRNIYDNKYVYPVLQTKNFDLSVSQREETEDYVRNQQLDVEKLEEKWAKRAEEQSDEEDISDYEP
jgi:hypothetical protein